jgi:hypothetical protein
MRHVTYALAVLTILTGCDAAKELENVGVQEQQPVALVFQSGYQVMVGGKSVPIFGTEACTSAVGFKRAMIGHAPEPIEGERTCVVIRPDTKSVNVLVGFGSSSQMETWVVERRGEKTMLWRSDGSLVLPSN